MINVANNATGIPADERREIDAEREFLECLRSLEGGPYVLSSTLSLLEAVHRSILNILLINYKKTLSRDHLY